MQNPNEIYSYRNLENNTLYLNHLLRRYQASPNDAYYILYEADIMALSPDVRTDLNLRVGSHISAMPYPPFIQVAILELIRNADDEDRPRHGDVEIARPSVPRYAINKDDIDELVGAVRQAANAGAAAANAGAAAANAGAAAADAGAAAVDYDPLDYNPNDPIFNPDAGAAAGAADGNDDYNALFAAMLLNQYNGAPVPAPAPAPAPVPAPAPTVMPADVARRAIKCAGGDCPISFEPLSELPLSKKAVTSCGHTFQKDCIAHPSLGGVCPICRSEFEINPIHKADVVGRPTYVPEHMKGPLALKLIREGKLPAISKEGKLSVSAYHMCNRCGNVVDKIPVPNKCPKCKKMGAFSGGSRKHKRNIRRKSKKLIKRKKTMKRR